MTERRSGITKEECPSWVRDCRVAALLAKTENISPSPSRGERKKTGLLCSKLNFVNPTFEKKFI